MTPHTLVARRVPFFRPEIAEAEIDEVVAVLRSGWLTTGSRVSRFEREFAAAVGARHAVALNSCTAALHLAVEALGLSAGQGVLVPTMTFAATAEIVRYAGAHPVLVDCDPVTGNMDLADAARKLAAHADRTARTAAGAILPPIVGLLPVHVGGLMIDMDAVHALAAEYGCWVVEDAAHAFPAAWRPDGAASWQRCGERTSGVTCFSFYANKTITTGEGGMAVTENAELADRIRMMSLHGLSHDAWTRYSGAGSWDYQIVAPGFKYNLTDVAAAIGIHQLARAEQMRVRRQALAFRYRSQLAPLDALDLPPSPPDRVHSWHLFMLRLRLDRLSITRNQFIEELRRAEIGCSVHWRPLHLHPYYRDLLDLHPADLPHATALFEQTISLPLFPAMADDDVDYVCDTIRTIVRNHSR